MVARSGRNSGNLKAPARPNVRKLASIDSLMIVRKLIRGQMCVVARRIDIYIQSGDFEISRCRNLAILETSGRKQVVYFGHFVDVIGKSDTVGF